jgi:hypothetical protein
MNELFPVYNIKIARELNKMGFEMVTVKPNKINRSLSVFFYESTDNFKVAFESLREKHIAEK